MTPEEINYEYLGEDSYVNGYTITKRGEEKEIGLGRLPDRCTVFHAEIMAILRATRVIRHRHASNTKRIDFMIDSRAAIMAIRRNEVI